MATTTMVSILEVSVSEDLDDRTSIGNAPNNSGPSTVVGSELFTRRVLPFEIHGPTPAPLETVLTAGPASELSIVRTVLIITTLAGLAFANSMSIGLITIGLPVIAADLDLALNLLLW